MFKRMFVMCLMVLLATLSVSAQPASTPVPYTAAAYLPDTGTLVLVNESDVFGEMVLPLPDGFDRNASSVAMLNGKIAYIARKQGATDKALVLGDVIAEGDASIVGMSAITPLRVDAAYTSFFLRAPGTFGLRDGKTHLAVGYGLDPLGWELLILDDRLQEVAKLTQDDLPDQPKDYGFTPYPIHFRPDGSLAFALVDAQAEGAQTPQVLVWNTFTGVISPTNTYAIETDVYTQTGELISINNGGLQWFNSYTGELARFYVAPSEGETMGKARFASDGQFVAFTKGGRLVLVGRDGVELGALPGTETASDWYGLRDGLVMSLNSTDGMTLYRVSLAGGLPADVNSYERLTTFPVGTIVQWVDSDMREGVRLVEHVKWAVVDGAVIDPLVVSGVSPLVEAQQAGEIAPVDVISAEGLFVGGWATTFTDDGDQLNVRAGAGTSFDTLTRVNPDVRVQLLEGPVEADGYVWWRVKFPTGSEGWLVQAVDGIQTLQPAAPPPTATPSPTPTNTPTGLPPTEAPLPGATQLPPLFLNEISNKGSTEANKVSVDFSWGAVPDAKSYLLEVLYCNDAGECSEGFSNETARTEFGAVFSINNPSLAIRWRVTARDAAGATLLESGYKDSVVFK